MSLADDLLLVGDWVITDVRLARPSGSLTGTTDTDANAIQAGCLRLPLTWYQSCFRTDHNSPLWGVFCAVRGDGHSNVRSPSEYASGEGRDFCQAAAAWVWRSFQCQGSSS